MKGEKVKALRKEHNWTQKELGQMLGINDSAVAKIENGRVRITFENAEKLAAIFKLPVSEFYEISDHFVELPNTDTSIQVEWSKASDENKKRITAFAKFLNDAEKD